MRSFQNNQSFRGHVSASYYWLRITTRTRFVIPVCAKARLEVPYSIAEMSTVRTPILLSDGDSVPEARIRKLVESQRLVGINPQCLLVTVRSLISEARSAGSSVLVGDGEASNSTLLCNVHRLQEHSAIHHVC